MNIKYLSLFFFIFISTQNIFAQKKNKKQYIQYKKGSYSFVQNIRKITGNIYTLEIETCKPNLIIDSVWFGGTPIPCDVYEPKQMHKATVPLQKGTYIIKANKDLYKNFYKNIDSTQAFKTFVSPFAFSAQAYIMYLYKNKRYYLPIKNVAIKEQKQTR